ncbi:hypothetical protein, partial [Escherichia coli]|uniref:hypothetical protein n=1 Tax=Escherichia coli TaxID=562 RepID=UPI001BFCCA63
LLPSDNRQNKNHIANKGLSQLFQTKAHLFFPISGIDSPQRSQNLVNYHPIFCPNVGYCSFFV